MMGISTAEFRSHPMSDGILAGFNNTNGFYQRRISLLVCYSKEKSIFAIQEGKPQVFVDEEGNTEA